MTRIWPKSLFGRNAMLLAATVAMSVVLSFVSIYALILNAQLNRFSSIAAELVNTISAAAYELPPESRIALIEKADASPYLRILSTGVVPEIGEHRENHIQRAFMQRFIDQLDFQTEMDWRVGVDQTLWLHLRIGDDFYWVAAESGTVWTPLRWLIFFICAIVIVVTAFGVIATRQLSLPLNALKRETDRLSLGTDWQMSEIKGPTEIQALSESFKRMTERIQEAETMRAETLAEMSHDLRTPLARLRLAVEMMSEQDDLKESASRQVQQIDRLIGQFMDYARGGETESKAVFDLSALVDEVATQFEVEHNIETGISITGQKEFIRRAVINLVENAQKYGAPPYRITLTQTPAHALIAVMDMGDGFDVSDTEMMLKSFSRGTHSKHISGSGLGLAIVERVAAAHAGNITFSKPDDSGFKAELSLPL
ncbi:MAG: ATP-binding protein [Pseudomonadota bacterium]